MIATTLILLNYLILPISSRFLFTQTFHYVRQKVASGTVDRLTIQSNVQIGSIYACGSICESLGVTCEMFSWNKALQVCHLATLDNNITVTSSDEADLIYIKGPLSPSDGNWAAWDSFGSCSLSCGPEGTSVRTRTCLNPMWGGKEICPGTGSNQESQACVNNPECPIDGHWAAWAAWGACSLSCGSGGAADRARTCEAPQFGGVAVCPSAGADTESGSCDEGPCPIDGDWTVWGIWSACSSTCGAGAITRNRSCDAPQYGGSAICPSLGLDSESNPCDDGPCPVDGNWAAWGVWETCSLTCGAGGSNLRSRTCDAPQFGGVAVCPNTGASNETGACDEGPCPIDGDWANWEVWTSCSSTCGNGTSDRIRNCDSPQFGGVAICPSTGSDTESLLCNDGPCPVDGNWATWGNWALCSASCIPGGTTTRSRTCNSPQNGGVTICPGAGLASETDTCNTATSCAVDGNWAPWGSSGTCSTTCGPGTITKTRTCDAPINGGAAICPSVGLSSNTSECNEEPCNLFYDFSWGTWGTMQTCTSPAVITDFMVKQGNSDQGITAFQAKCSDGAVVEGMNALPSRGDWAASFESCPGGYIGMWTTTEPYQGLFSYDSAINCVRLWCSDDGSWHESQCDHETGTEQNQSCEPGAKLCGVVQRIDHSNGDNSGLNGLEFKCCI